MNLQKSFIKVYKDVIDPSTNKPQKTVMWPPTKQTKTIPLLKDLPDNSLHEFKFWMYDPVSVVDVHDLMRFGENDIHLLGRSQIQCDPQYEVCVIAFTAGVAQIIQLKCGLEGKVGLKHNCLACTLGTRFQMFNNR
ncbi:hypothetical protein Hanom_Chr12g01143101 [Helianthus anomalus]